jgi:hypothetical protein
MRVNQGPKKSFLNMEKKIIQIKLSYVPVRFPKGPIKEVPKKGFKFLLENHLEKYHSTISLFHKFLRLK